MAKTCPWCNATGTYYKDGSGRVLVWECGSWESHSSKYQAAECKNKLLEAENERLRNLVLTPEQFRALATFILRHKEM